MLLKITHTKNNKSKQFNVKAFSHSLSFSDSHTFALKVQHVWSSVKAVTEPQCGPEH